MARRYCNWASSHKVSSLRVAGNPTIDLRDLLTPPRLPSQSSEVRIPVGPSQFFNAPLCPLSIKWVAGLLRPGESKGGEESNGKLPQNAFRQEQPGP
ncbi:hypothetical protein PoB_000177000 [Plakobranchus ocellatus]|uniref:Uncharacterized protein n=1 Tax=Plakobranchus ocellatus TaxID=259542 RepID=A0AAV3XXX5_9GAST|nr:hypothetical protein PoB_000177000 [Plakobranchus ocellatus]